MAKLLTALSIFTPDFYETLRVMGLGMLGIFIVMGLIYLVIILLGKIPEKKDKDKGKEE